ncbi:MAG: hypothetical protein HZA52_02475 [Planctomycetes bacterium]|nr:hypothetical protein [Planctomycetota bacterium]
MLRLLCSALLLADRSAPQVAIHFPPDGSVTDASTITVTGAAHDEHGVVAVTVDGVAASSNDGFATWRANVPVTQGVHEYRIGATDSLGNTDPDAARVRVVNRGPISNIPGPGVLDADGGTLYCLDADWWGVLGFDLTTGNRWEVSTTTTGSGPLPTNLGAIGRLETTGELVFCEYDGGLILRVHPGTGARTVVSSYAVGTGPPIYWKESLVHDPSGDRLLTGGSFGFYGSGVGAVDLATGNRSILSGASVGKGPGLGSELHLDLDELHGRVVVTDYQHSAILGVDLASGDRTMIASWTVGSGARIAGPRGLSVAASGERAWVVDDWFQGLMEVDLASGVRTWISRNGDGRGPWLSKWMDVSVDEARGLAYVLDYRGAFAIDLLTGARTLVNDCGRGDGRTLEKPMELVLDRERSRVITRSVAFPYSATVQGLFEIDLRSGDRRSISDVGQWPHPEPLQLDFDAQRRALVMVGGLWSDAELVRVDADSGEMADLGFAVLSPPSELVWIPPGRALLGYPSWVDSFDLLTGKRSVLTGPGVGSGPTWYFTAGMDFDATANELLIASRSLDRTIFGVDAQSGDRRTVADASLGGGPPTGTLGRISVDSVGRKLYALVTSELWSIDLTNGTWTLVTRGRPHWPSKWNPGQDVGTGPFLESPADIVIAPEHGVVFASSPISRGLMAIEVSSGDRVIVSR